MAENMKETTILHNSVEMPKFGLGVYKVEDGLRVEETVKSALQIGYRSIDTASFYDNEEGVGKAIKASGVPREELFITTKVWNTEQGYDSTLKAFDESMKKLELDYLDLYLIHWPVKDTYLETWRALETLYREGRVRAIGVSNFKIEHLNDLLMNAKEKPAVNQVELHPHLTQLELRQFCKTQNIKVEAWSPLARGRILNEPLLTEIALSHGKTPAQIILRWHLQNDIIIIPKSVTPARLKENSEIFDFHLNQDEIEKINQMNKNQRYGSDPDSFDFS
ncbi:aldo/keto reductase [Mesobacillus harenae]|uniref:aldo/keto reductase n=1 Tax=Mesobacillus harenae TaxID=2213203 RepID=UPI0015809BB6|nr:aldo/keto reductase [Mesobacillus harenae]